jgi:malonyl-CoA decarboxylase
MATGFSVEPSLAAQKCLELCLRLEAAAGGGAPERRLADAAIAAYTSLDAAGRVAFLEAAAREALGPKLFLRLRTARQGTAFLVHLRGDVLQGLRAGRPWQALDADLLRVLRSVFDFELLEFRRIDGSASPDVLEKLMRFEAVHAIADWRAMRRRLEADRRCYGFFHPDWRDEPIIFTEVALTRGLSAKVQPLLDPESPIVDERTCDTAVFYSITNCQSGLRGLAFGNALICRVVEDISAQLPRIRRFATLSPIPGFRSWLSAVARDKNCPANLAALVAKMSRAGWSRDVAASAELRRALMPLCARFLLYVKEGVEPADPVARFHLGNGARLRRVNWLSDISGAGMARSAGLTANYVYEVADLEANRQRYEKDHKVRTTREIERLSRQAIDVSAPERPLPISA